MSVSEIELQTESPSSELANEPNIYHRAASLGESVVVPFSEEAKAPIVLLSRALLSESFAAEQPQLRVLGYWLRPAAIHALSKGLENRDRGIRVARGFAFHLPPENVDTIFSYSWAISCLMGNSNLTRLPSELNATARWLVDLIDDCLQRSGQYERHIFCQFSRESELTRSLSSIADLRVIWGGDQKVEQISVFPTRPDGLTLAFPDRKSFSIIKTAEYLQLDFDGKVALADRFVNDVYWFDQMGCGSPRLLCWVGDAEPPEAEFMSILNEAAKSKNKSIDVGTDIQKFVKANELIGNGDAESAVRYGSHLTTVNCVAGLDAMSVVQGGGFLMQSRMQDLSSLESLIRRDLQTITYFGFNQDEKESIARASGGRGGYRIVPIGQALDFDTIWDGMDLPRHFSREIVIL